MQRAASCSRRLLGRRTRSFERAFTSSSSVQLTRDGRRVVLGIERFVPIILEIFVRSG